MPIYKLIPGRNKFHSEQTALPGGTAQIIRGDWTGRITATIQDSRGMGRWCGSKIRLKHDRHLYIICAYRVCDQSLSQVGVETAYAQQHYMLSIDGFDHPKPRRQFIEDLTTTIRQFQSGLDEFLIVLDANEKLGSNLHGLTYLMRECNLINLFHQHHGICPTFPTYDDGRNRLDYAIGSASLLPYVHKCGYLPFYQGVSSDHRGLFIDFSLELIDGLTRLEHVPRRHLNSVFQKDVFKYKQYVQKEFLSHNVFEKASNLFFQSGPIKLDNMEYKLQLEQLDQLVVDIQLKAEISCCQNRTKFDWSDDIHYHKIILNYWFIRKKAVTKRINVWRVTQKIYDALPDEYRQYIDVATGSAGKNWEDTKSKLKFLMSQHKKILHQRLQASFENEAEFTGTTAEKVKLKKERIKTDKKLFTTLRHHFHPCTRSGISHLLVPDKDAAGNSTNNVDEATSWKSETCLQEILDKLLERNIKHFGQAQGSPFTTSPLYDKFGYDGITIQGTQLSQDSILPSGIKGISSATTDVLNRLGDTSKKHPIQHDLITFESFTSAIKKWRESTSTSPSGRHLGHYKSLVAIDSNSSKYTEAHPYPGLEILKVLFHLSAAAFQTGITLSRWANITTCMIEKIPGTPRINKLRIIHLYEADYNVMNKLIWQRGVVWTAHNRGTLNTAQSGSRPYWTSIEVVLSKDMKYLNSNLTRAPMATMDNDAKSCYDRIVASLALMISHHFGVPEEICRTVGETLRTMKFRLRTAMGDSDEFYSHSPDTPIHGVGQGGTASPAFWLLVSSTLFDCHRENAQGMLLSDPTCKISLKQWLEALVDDSSIFKNVASTSSLADLTQTLQQDAQYWENLLSISGGCLELSKCFYYVLAWTFTQEGDSIPISMTDLAKATTPIQIQEFGKDISTEIESKAPEVAHKTLGVWNSMIGNDTKHINHLKTRNYNMSSIVSTSGLRPYQADVALRMIYTPAMTYSLPAVNISEKVLDKIQAKSLESFIPALGFNRNFPRPVVLGPKAFGGEGIPHLHTESNIQKIEILMANIRGDTELGTLFRINLSWIHLLVGRGESYLNSHYDIPYVQNWFTGVRNFLISINGRINIPQVFLPKLERIGDVYIMEMMSNITPKLSANQLRYIHNWRLYYQVNTLSDLCNAKGDQMLEVYLKHPKDIDINQLRKDRTSKLHWPHQAPPESIKTFKLWIRSLRLCFLSESGRKIRKPLGAWISSPNDLSSHWTGYMSQDHSSFISRSQNRLMLYSYIFSYTPGTTNFTSDAQLIPSIPSMFFPVDSDILGDNMIKVYNLNRDMLLLPPSAVSQYTDIQAAIFNAPSWQRSLLQYFRIHDLDQLQQCLRHQETKMYLVSDGGLKDQKGSFGVSAGTHEDELFRIEGPAPGYAEHANSYRSEAYGLLAGVNFLCLLLQIYPIPFSTKRNIYLFCDNLSLVRCIQRIILDQTYPRMFIRSDSDVILQIAHDIQWLTSANINIILAHVKGHQDDTVDYCNLSGESQFNVEADKYVTNYIREGTIISYEELPANPISLYLNDEIINQDFKTEIRNASRPPQLRIYMICRFNWHSNTPDMIWWKIHGSTIKSFSSPDRRRIRKMIFGWLPTCRRMKKYKKELSDLCPSCNTHVETNDHLFKCQCKSRIIVKNKWLEVFDRFLANERYTPPIIRMLFFNHIISFFSNEVVVLPTGIPTIIQQGMHDQKAIGWKQLLFGRLAYKWSIVIADHLVLQQVDNKEISALVWGRRITRMVFEVDLHYWKQRNTDGHLLTQHQESNLTRTRLYQRIEYFQSVHHDIPHQHRDFVYREFDVLESYTNSNLRSWLKLAENLVRVSKPRRRLNADISQYLIQSPNVLNSVEVS